VRACNATNHFVHTRTTTLVYISCKLCLQCFGTVDWASGRTAGL